MKIAYASRTGNVESIVNQLGFDSISIEQGTERVDEPYVLFTYTDGWGDVPEEVETFLDNNDSSFLLGVVVSGDKGYDEAYCLAGDKIAEATGCDVLYKVENEGTEEDIAAIRDKLNQLN
ncbi:MAG: class Ib ribonucleoside-diphosphate reductase assembly flavoprotein NrdI [Clostridiaceae bacterium]|nr:class Ib ribonucleoside-diphosphate reductase assembly flavoprotein NrdI [Clostridiaceae bacterium]